MASVCNGCHRNLRPGSRFCPRCGTAVARVPRRSATAADRRTETKIDRWTTAASLTVCCVAFSLLAIALFMTIPESAAVAAVVVLCGLGYGTVFGGREKNG